MIENAVRTIIKNKSKHRPMYWFIDVNNTILPRYQLGIERQPYTPPQEAIEVLKWLTQREDMTIIIWTNNSHDYYVRLKNILKMKYNIILDAYNKTSHFKYNDDKPYFDILLDDKAGFDINTDWKKIKDTLIELGEWDSRGELVKNYKKV